MANILPFKGIFYNQKKIKNITSVLAPPWDIISRDEQNKYYARSEYNVIKLVLGKEFANDNEYSNKEKRAGAFLKKWSEEKILIEDWQDNIYYLEQTFKTPLGETKKRGGVIALCEVEDPQKGKILPHERTQPKGVENRLKLLAETRTNFSQIFTLYEDREKILENLFNEGKEEGPLFDFTDWEGTKQTLYRLKASHSKKISQIFTEKTLIIADGHHRYQAALEYKNEKNMKYTLIYSTDMNNKSLGIFPIHRIAKGENIFENLKNRFSIKPCKDKIEMLKTIKQGKVGLYLKKDKFCCLNTGNGKRVDTEYLDYRILKPPSSKLAYSHDIKDIINKVDSGEFSLGLFLAESEITKVKEAAIEKKKMPDKSTYFWPKLLSGLVMRVH